MSSFGENRGDSYRVQGFFFPPGDENILKLILAMVTKTKELETSYRRSSGRQRCELYPKLLKLSHGLGPFSSYHPHGRKLYLRAAVLHLQVQRSVFSEHDSPQVWMSYSKSKAYQEHSLGLHRLSFTRPQQGAITAGLVGNGAVQKKNMDPHCYDVWER